MKQTKIGHSWARSAIWADANSWLRCSNKKNRNYIHDNWITHWRVRVNWIRGSWNERLDLGIARIKWWTTKRTESGRSFPAGSAFGKLRSPPQTHKCRWVWSTNPIFLIWFSTSN
jgi:hypothetical protein